MKEKLSRITTIYSFCKCSEFQGVPQNATKRYNKRSDSMSQLKRLLEQINLIPFEQKTMKWENVKPKKQQITTILPRRNAANFRVYPKTQQNDTI